MATSALERTRELPQCLPDQAGFREAIASLDQEGRATFDGVWGSSCALLAAALRDAAPGPVVVVCPRAGDMDVLCDDLALFTSHVPWRFPA